MKVFLPSARVSSVNIPSTNSRKTDSTLAADITDAYVFALASYVLAMITNQ